MPERDGASQERLGPSARYAATRVPGVSRVARSWAMRSSSGTRPATNAAARSTRLPLGDRGPPQLAALPAPAPDRSATSRISPAATSTSGSAQTVPAG